MENPYEKFMKNSYKIYLIFIYSYLLISKFYWNFMKTLLKIYLILFFYDFLKLTLSKPKICKPKIFSEASTSIISYIGDNLKENYFCQLGIMLKITLSLR
jgi:hypothetical protein